VWVLHLEAAHLKMQIRQRHWYEWNQGTHLVLEKESEGSIVTMCTGACSTILLQEGRFDRRVREETEVMALFVDLVVEERLSKVQSQGNGSHDVDMQAVGCL
jgi:hypothetical protein